MDEKWKITSSTLQFEIQARACISPKIEISKYTVDPQNVGNERRPQPRVILFKLVHAELLLNLGILRQKCLRIPECFPSKRETSAEVKCAKGRSASEWVN